MGDSESMNQHLEMMIQKQNRCEDWVAAVARQKQVSADEGKQPEFEFVDVEFIDDYADRSVTDESVKRRQRKSVNHSRISSTLFCEWNRCDFGVTQSQSTFFQHVNYHAEKLIASESEYRNETYRCQWEACNFETIEKNHLRRHITYHGYHSILKAVGLHLHELWEFPVCKLENENKNLLPDLTHSFQCEAVNCGYSSHYFHLYLSHVNEHMFDLKFSAINRLQTNCFWIGCTFKCRKLAQMKMHVRGHTGEKVVACSTCGAMFATNTKYMDHCTRKILIQDEANRCQYCLRYFSNERLLRDHLRYHVNRHKCPFCEITCSTPAVLANHVRYKHIKDRPFKCSDCSFRSVKADDCIMHMSTHDSDPKFECQAEGCTFACAALQTFNNHFRSVHLMVDGPVYCCHLCDKKYKRGTLLGKHLREIHELERPPGHTRFRYMEGVDGNYRLQIERYESIETNEVEVSPVATSEKLPNFVLKFEPAETLSCPKITISVDNYEESDRGALIAIDEIDEMGRIVQTRTVRERMIEMESSNLIFVDAESSEQKKVDCESYPPSYVSNNFPVNESECNVLSPKLLRKTYKLQHFTRKRRKYNHVKFSDMNHSQNEIVLRDVN